MERGEGASDQSSIMWQCGGVGCRSSVEKETRVNTSRGEGKRGAGDQTLAQRPRQQREAVSAFSVAPEPLHTHAHQNKRTREINTAPTSAPAVRCQLSAPLRSLLLLLRQSRYPEGCTHCNEKSTNRDTRGSVSPVSQCMHLEGFGWVAGAQRSIVLQYKRKKRQKKEEKKQTGLVTSSKGTGKGKRSNATGAAAVRMSLDVSLVSPSPSMLCSLFSPQISFANVTPLTQDTRRTCSWRCSGSSAPCPCSDQTRPFPLRP